VGTLWRVCFKRPSAELNISNEAAEFFFRARHYQFIRLPHLPRKGDLEYKPNNILFIKNSLRGLFL